MNLVPQKFVEKLFYTWSLSLSWQLRSWTRGSHPVVHVPSSGASLTWALLLTLSLLAKLLMHGTAQCIANLGVRSLLELASQGAFVHLPCGLVGRLHNLHRLHLWRCARTDGLLLYRRGASTRRSGNTVEVLLPVDLVIPSRCFYPSTW